VTARFKKKKRVGLRTLSSSQQGQTHKNLRVGVRIE